MWSILYKGSKWSEYIEHLLEKITINSDNINIDSAGVVDVAEVYPQRVCDISLPVDKTGENHATLEMLPCHQCLQSDLIFIQGYVYLIASTCNLERTTWVRPKAQQDALTNTTLAKGQHQQLQVRVFGDDNLYVDGESYSVQHCPYCVAAYLCNMGHMNRSQQMLLEKNWKRKIERLIRE